MIRGEGLGLRIRGKELVVWFRVLRCWLALGSKELVIRGSLVIL